MSPAPLLSTQEYFLTPESVLPTEVIYGALRVAESPTVRHQQALGAIYFALETHVRRHRAGTVLLAPTDVVFDEARALILQPDLLFIARSRQHELIRQQRIFGAPDMVLEILSPQPRIGRLHERLDWFVRYGVREIWLLHQEDERFEILTAVDGRIVSREGYGYDVPIRSAVLPAFSPTINDMLLG